MKKNLKDFDKYFGIALHKSKIKMDYNLFTFEDLKQECYIIYDRMEESINDESYPYYVIGRLTGAILDYRRRVLKLRTYPNYTCNVSINEPAVKLNKCSKKGFFTFFNGPDLSIEEILPEQTNNERNIEAEDIASEVMNDPKFHWKEKEFFDLFFIQDINSPRIAKIWGVSEPMVSTYKTKVEKKLRKKYGKES